MNILVIGGTSFVGRHIVEAAVSRGHKVTLFNRGKSNPGLFAELPRIIGDRRSEAQKLRGVKWDSVIDTSAYTPADLTPVLDNINSDHYTFVSTISVYDDFTKGPVTEKSTIYKAIAGDEVNGKTYGPLKVKCEQLLNERFGEKAMIIRPGIVAGAHDPTDRFTYWALKLQERGKTVIPGHKSRKIQWIDARDLAEFTVRNIENRTNGTYNLTANPVTMEELVKTLSSPDIQEVWVADEVLAEAGVTTSDVPLWMPTNKDFPEGFILADNTKAKGTGWEPRGLGETAEAVRQWKSGSGSEDLSTGIHPEKEQEILAFSENAQ